MYSLVVGSIQLMFSSAMITVRRDISHHNWRDDVGAYAPQEVQISQGDRRATVLGLSGTHREIGPHNVLEITPKVYTVIDLARHLSKSTKGPLAEEFLSVMVLTDYSWGQLIEVNWSALDYCPGGLHYYLMPRAHPAIDLAGLKLDWPSLIVQPVDCTHSNFPFQRTPGGAAEQ